MIFLYFVSGMRGLQNKNHNQFKCGAENLIKLRARFINAQ